MNIIGRICVQLIFYFLNLTVPFFCLIGIMSPTMPNSLEHFSSTSARLKIFMTASVLNPTNANFLSLADVDVKCSKWFCIVGDIIPIRQKMKPSSSGRVITEFILRDQKMELQMKILQPWYVLATKLPINPDVTILLRTIKNVHNGMFVSHDVDARFTDYRLRW